MFVDRSVRSLRSLGGASTSRVLNLMSIALNRNDDPEHKAKPLFTSPVFNRAILVRHRVRSDDSYLFATRRSIATKIIVPFDERDLKLGGRSFFVDQRGYADAIQKLGNYRDSSGMERDLEIPRLIDTVPSLDPFLLREHLRINQFDVGDCYFEISETDRKRMFLDLARNIQGLIQLATLLQMVDERLLAASFWRYRFPRGQVVRADAEELTAIFQDFESGFGLVPPPLALAS